MSSNSETKIHPSAVVEDGAKLGDGVLVGPLCHVGPEVVLGDGVELLGQVSVQGVTSVGAGTRIFPFASVGSEPQDMKYHGEKVSLEIGNGCTIREGVTMNPGTEGGGLITKIGNNSVFMANSHVAHDCTVGNNVIFSNNVMLAGHCIVGDSVIFGGGSGAGQFTTIGHHAFVGGLSGVGRDLIPFGTAIGIRADLAGLNLIGMKRAGIDRESIHSVRAAYKVLFKGDRPVMVIAAEMRETTSDASLIDVLDFILASKVGVLCPSGNE